MWVRPCVTTPMRSVTLAKKNSQFLKNIYNFFRNISNFFRNISKFLKIFPNFQKIFPNFSKIFQNFKMFLSIIICILTRIRGPVSPEILVYNIFYMFLLITFQLLLTKDACLLVKFDHINQFLYTL